MAVDLERSHARFEATSWSLIAAARRHDEGALDTLVRRYWPPVYTYVRSRGYERNAAADLTQSFFADVVLGRKLFERADQDRGHLRSLLLTALTNFIRDGIRQRGSRIEAHCLPLERISQEDARAQESHESPEQLFDRRWALLMLEEAIRRCEAHYCHNGREKHWELFERRIFRPSVGGHVPPSMTSLSEILGFESQAAASAALQVVKKRALALLTEVVAETLDDPSELPSELADIERLLETPHSL